MNYRTLSIGIFILAVVGFAIAAYWAGHPSQELRTLHHWGPPQLPTENPYGLKDLFAFDPEHFKMLLSLVVALVALAVIVAKQGASQDKHWAYGAIGTIIGFWLNSH